MTMLNPQLPPTQYRQSIDRLLIHFIRDLIKILGAKHNTYVDVALAESQEMKHHGLKPVVSSNTSASEIRRSITPLR